MATTTTGVELDLRDLVQGAVKRAMELGATAAESVVSEGSEFGTVVRLGEVETLKESGSRGLGVRVFVGQHTANTTTSDYRQRAWNSWCAERLSWRRSPRKTRWRGFLRLSNWGSLRAT